MPNFNKGNLKGNKNYRNIGLYLLVLIITVSIISSFFEPKSSTQEFTYSQFLKEVEANNVSKVTIKENSITGSLIDGTKFSTYSPNDPELISILRSKNIIIEAKPPVEVSWWMRLLSSILPMLLIIGVWLFMLQQMQGGGNKVMSFGKSRAKLLGKETPKVTFKDVAGIDEAEEEVVEVIEFLKNPAKFKRLGAKIPRGILLYGPPGAGKTLLARAIAGEAGVPFFSISGSDFVEMFVGVGASRVRDLFKQAKANAPCIIFMDEIDAVGRHRGAGLGGGHDEREQTLNQLLVEMDGFTKNDNVIVMAATNRGDMLDPALVRPGRFDRRVQVNLPDLKERQFILKIHARNKSFNADVSWEKVAKRTVGFSGADLENMLNEAAISAARESRQKINMEDIEEASMKVKYGPSKKRLLDELEKKMTAYHEAGHAILSHVLPYTDPVHRISIVSRGQALGYTFTPPEKDKLQILKSELLENMIVMFGGRAAEILVFNEQTAGAANDISRATRIARSMVVRYGMSKLGPMYFGPEYADNDYNRVWGEPERPSDKFAQAVDEEILTLISEAESKALQLLKKYRKELDKVAEALLDKETLDSDEFTKVMGMKKARR